MTGLPRCEMTVHPAGGGWTFEAGIEKSALAGLDMAIVMAMHSHG